ncbi:MAG: hypothetical protein RIR31_307 [Bacteroidota bacterium]
MILSNEEMHQALTEKLITIEQLNKKLEIETSLEQVRVVALAMSKREDMIAICRCICRQLQLLNVKEIRNVQTAIIYQSKGTYLNYEYYAKHDKLLTTEVEFKNHKLQNEFANQMLKGAEELFTEHIKGAALKKWYEYQKTTNQFVDVYLEKASSLSYYFYSLGPVALGISTYAPLNEEEINLFKRFRNVFELAYRRFMDIEQAAAQTKEAQIELALERVRARTMAMQHSDELREVVMTIYEQLQHLDFNAQACNIVIADRMTGDREFWVSGFAKEMYPESYKVPYINHPYVNKQLDAWKHGEKYAVFEYTGKRKKDFDAIFFSATDFRNIPDDAKRMMIELPSVIFSTAFFNYGSLQALGKDALSTENADILKRFAKVFEQTYTRFLDLQKAEAQAREAQIETALERVRSRTMAMQKSEELAEVSVLLFEQLKILGVSTYSSGFSIWENEALISWMCNADGSINPPFSMPVAGDAWHRLQYESWKKGEEFIWKDLQGGEMQSHFRHLRSFPLLDEAFKKSIAAGHPMPERQVHHVANFSQGNLLFITLQPCPEAHDIFKRFAKVFEQTYTRFNDLQKAEAQTREAQINLAVERVRARALAMYKSEEILELVFKLKQEMMDLDIPNVVAATIHLKEKDGNYTMWDLTALNFTEGKFHQPMVVHYQLEKVDPNLFIKRMWENTNPYFLVVQDEEDLKRTLQFLRDHGRVKEADESEDFIKTAGIKYAYHPAIPLHNGRMCIDLLEPPSDEIEQILTKMGAAFDLAYKRFEDLKNSEAQLKEAQIEAALERVRSRSMAMHKSEELKEVIKIVYQQLRHLKINLDHAGFVVDYTPKGDWHFWIADEQDIPSKITHPYFESVWANQFNEAKEKNTDFFATNLNFEEKNKFYHELLSYVPGLPQASKDFYLSCPGLAATTVLFDNASLYIENFLGIPYSGEENTTLMRFGKVFQQTYTRFLDLKKAEAQAREAQIELGLERVRARAMAMQNSDELSALVATLFEELKKLDLVLARCIIWIFNPETFDARLWMANSEDKKYTTSYFIKRLHHPYYDAIIKGWAEKKSKWIYELQGNDKKTIDELLLNETELTQLTDAVKAGIRAAEHTIVSGSFNNFGLIEASGPVEQTEEQLDIISRFGKVFDLTYTRFNDLKQAEHLAKQAQLDLENLMTEKKKTEEALTDLKAAQSQLIQSEKMASLGELTAGIAHEIQNPLNFVNNFSEVSNELLDEMMEEVAKGNYEEVKAIVNDVKQNLEKINHHGKRADGIVKGMLQHSRSSSATKEPTDINKLADEYFRLAYHGLRAKDKSFNATLKTDYDDSIGNINIIPQDIGRVILNLITNAFYAAPLPPEGGFSDPDYVHNPTVWLSTKKMDNKVLISVRDNGPGIPQKILDKIFQPFFTTKPTGQGTGLGLSLSYDIVKAHGGELKVETKEGEGSEFIIQLPI